MVGPVPFVELLGTISKGKRRWRPSAPTRSTAGQARTWTLESDRGGSRSRRGDPDPPFSLPNFHFHAVTAYDILRSRRVLLGKRDYEGQLRTRSTSLEADPPQRLVRVGSRCTAPRPPSSCYLSTRRVDHQAQRGVVVRLEARMHEGKGAVRAV